MNAHTQNQMREAIRAAVSRVPGKQAGLARAIGCSQSLVAQWSTGMLVVMPERCPAIERVSGIPVEELRPDLEWIRTDGKPTGYVVNVAEAA